MRNLKDMTPADAAREADRIAPRNDRADRTAAGLLASQLAQPSAGDSVEKAETEAGLLRAERDAADREDAELFAEQLAEDGSDSSEGHD